METLPKYIIHMIFSYLPLHDGVSLSMVTKRIYSIIGVRKPQFYDQITSEYPSLNLNRSTFRIIIPNNITTLDIHNRQFYHCILPKSLKNLTLRDASGCIDLPDDISLISLNLPGYTHGTTTRRNLSCKALSKLEVFRCRDVKSHVPNTVQTIICDELLVLDFNCPNVYCRFTGPRIKKSVIITNLYLKAGGPENMILPKYINLIRI